MVNERREKFIRLAESRVNKTIRDIRLIGNLANRNNYDYSESDSQQIITALDKELKELKSRFGQGQQENQREFRIKRERER